ncbi:hypothetical protein MTP99_011662 [Tenebrio molitor]|nr:hypothetical protein MTP99_011662 [Tenebrio molitor]CAH1370131.1 unnamed protein product [Tenebrio molitor]
MKALLIFAFVLCFFFSEVRALQCYKCLNSNCGTLSKQECSAEDTCWSSSFVANGVLLQRKECVFSTTQVVENCVTVNQLLGGNCYMCQEDLCNEAW